MDTAATFNICVVGEPNSGKNMLAKLLFPKGHSARVRIEPLTKLGELYVECFRDPSHYTKVDVAPPEIKEAFIEMYNEVRADCEQQNCLIMQQSEITTIQSLRDASISPFLRAFIKTADHETHVFNDEWIVEIYNKAQVPDHFVVKYHFIGNNYADFMPEITGANAIIYVTTIDQPSIVDSDLYKLVADLVLDEDKIPSHLVVLVNKCDSIIDGTSKPQHPDTPLIEEQFSRVKPCSVTKTKSKPKSKSKSKAEPPKAVTIMSTTFVWSYLIQQYEAMTDNIGGTGDEHFSRLLASLLPDPASRPTTAETKAAVNLIRRREAKEADDWTENCLYDSNYFPLLEAITGAIYHNIKSSIDLNFRTEIKALMTQAAQAAVTGICIPNFKSKIKFLRRQAATLELFMGVSTHTDHTDLIKPLVLAYVQALTLVPVTSVLAAESILNDVRSMLSLYYSDKAMRATILAARDAIDTRLLVAATKTIKEAVLLQDGNHLERINSCFETMYCTGASSPQLKAFLLELAGMYESMLEANLESGEHMDNLFSRFFKPKGKLDEVNTILKYTTDFMTLSSKHQCELQFLLLKLRVAERYSLRPTIPTSHAGILISYLHDLKCLISTCFNPDYNGLFGMLNEACSLTLSRLTPLSMLDYVHHNLTKVMWKYESDLTVFELELFESIPNTHTNPKAESLKNYFDPATDLDKEYVSDSDSSEGDSDDETEISSDEIHPGPRHRHRHLSDSESESSSLLEPKAKAAIKAKPVANPKPQAKVPIKCESSSCDSYDTKIDSDSPYDYVPSKGKIKSSSKVKSKSKSKPTAKPAPKAMIEDSSDSTSGCSSTSDSSYYSSMTGGSSMTEDSIDPKAPKGSVMQTYLKTLTSAQLAKMPAISTKTTKSRK